MKSWKEVLPYLASALFFLMATVVVLAVRGTTCRVVGPVHAVGQGAVEVVAVERPEDAFQVWKRRGYRGRVVVTFSRWLNFLDTEETRRIPATSPFPVSVGNLSRMAEQELASGNFLFVAMKSGIARELVQVVPEADIAAKIAAAAAEGVSARQGMLKIPFMGSPRTITSPVFFPLLREPVLLYVNASFFRDVEPVELIRLLERGRVTTDCVIVATSATDGEVGTLERQRLAVFKELLEGRHEGR